MRSSLVKKEKPVKQRKIWGKLMKLVNLDISDHLKTDVSSQLHGSCNRSLRTLKVFKVYLQWNFRLYSGRQDHERHENTSI